MAFKQSPGRGNNPKTGHGLPSPLRQEIELTKKYEEDKKKMAANRAKGSTDTGLNVDVRTGVASAKPYEKTFVENKRTGGASIISGDKKTTASATNYGGGKNVEKLRQRFLSDSASTMNSRTRNAELYNATGGGTSPDKLSGKQKKTLISLRKAIKIK